jgi:hypothetical protein
MQAKAAGYPDLRIIVIPHPLGGIPKEAALAKAAAAVEAVARIAEGGSAGR